MTICYIFTLFIVFYLNIKHQINIVRLTLVNPVSKTNNFYIP